MKVLNIKENDDGSATIELEMTEEENNILLEYAIVDILKKQIKKSEEGSDEH